ncbi:MAG: hypothetical protein HDT47_06375 [Ruminococcaceae bacterium]|nr:hypothetical protein [Oscillospiraceae bacterium]
MDSLEQLNLAAPIVSTYTEIEETILCHIAEQLAANPDTLINATSEWRIKMLAQMGRVNEDTARIIASKVGKIPAEVQQVVQSSIDKVISEHGLEMNGKIEESVAAALKNYDLQAVKDKYNQVNTVMQYKAKQAYVSGINSVADKLLRKEQEALKNSQEYIDILNKNAMATVMGEKSRTEAIRETIAEMSKKGIPAFVDKTGREWSPEAYIDMDIRNTAKNAALAAEFASLDELGQDIILVSSHSGSRPLCAPYQGKLYSRSGKSGTITDAKGKTYTYTPLSDTSFGEAAGLFGINCGHRMRGVSDGTFINREKEFDGEETSEEYKKVQQQRALEREVRKKKTEANMLEAAGEKDAARDLRRLAADEDRKLRAYCEKEGLYYRRDRAEVYGYKNKVDISENGGIIKIKEVSEVKDALVNKVGFSNVEESFDLIDNELKIANTNQIMKLEEKFGCIHKSKGTICSVSDSESPSTIAYVNSRVIHPSMQNLSLCPQYFNSYSDLILTQRKAVKNNWSMPVKLTDEELSIATVTHEYGHILQNILIENEMKIRGWKLDEPGAFIDITKKKPESRLKWYFNIRSKVLDDCFVEIVDIAKKENPDFILVNNISRYGCKDKAEFFAEVFMNSQLGEPNELGKAMNIWLKRKGLC